MTDPTKAKIQQLAEMHVMLSLGEFTPDNFAKAFHYRFRKEVDAVKRRRHKQSNYGWDDIDWDKFEANPILKQLLA